MEAQHQAANEDNNGGSGSGPGNKGGNFICSSRQTSTRWTPTSEQIRILKELYYNSGLRSPTADQIQKISATLRQYGKIEGKNVFYWFQNHKARERQKKRFSASTTTTITTGGAAATTTNVSDHLPMQKANTFVTTHDNNKFNNNFALGHHGLSSAGQTGNYGSVAMEKSFGNCSISASQVDQQENYAYVGIENYSPYNYTNFFDKKRPIELEEDQEYCYFNDHHHQQQEDHQEAETRSYQIRKTLELFPVPNFHEDHDHQIKTGFMNFRSAASSWFGSDLDHHHGDHHHHRHHHHQHHAGSRASLELTLNSYTAFSGSNDCV